FYKPENTDLENQKTELSPSGNYKLIIISYGTQKGCWDYTKGDVYDSQNNLIFEVKRNYSSFPFLWIENHSNGNTYLVCGEDYQGQTVLELNTGKRLDFLPEAAKKGHGFCWADYRYHKESNILTVCGCFWACSY